MNESLILSEFDKLQQSGLALYDQNQKIIKHVEGGLKVRILADFWLLLSQFSNIRTIVPILCNFRSGKEADLPNATVKRRWTSRWKRYQYRRIWNWWNRQRPPPNSQQILLG